MFDVDVDIVTMKVQMQKVQINISLQHLWCPFWFLLIFWEKSSVFICSEIFFIKTRLVRLNHEREVASRVFSLKKSQKKGWDFYQFKYWKNGQEESILSGERQPRSVSCGKISLEIYVVNLFRAKYNRFASLHHQENFKGYNISTTKKWCNRERAFK